MYFYSYIWSDKSVKNGNTKQYVTKMYRSKLNFMFDANTALKFQLKIAKLQAGSTWVFNFTWYKKISFIFRKSAQNQNFASVFSGRSANIYYNH